jgi:hypothetical protein
MDEQWINDWRDEEPSDAMMSPRKLVRTWLEAALAEPTLADEEP